jgi:hypothetical protein
VTFGYIFIYIYIYFADFLVVSRKVQFWERFKESSKKTFENRKSSGKKILNVPQRMEAYRTYFSEEQGSCTYVGGGYHVAISAPPVDR